MPATRRILSRGRDWIACAGLFVGIGCASAGALPTEGSWSVRSEVNAVCWGTRRIHQPADSIFRRFLRAVADQQIAPELVDPRAMRVLIAGPLAPHYSGSRALRQARVLVEFRLDTVPDEEGRILVMLGEGASMRPRAMPASDSGSLLRQSSRLARNLARRAGLGDHVGGCWAGQ